MDFSLSVHVQVYREKFINEHFCSSDHIFALVCSGSFFAQRGDTRFDVKEGEGLVFQKEVPYYRKVLTPVTLHLFRYVAKDPLFQQEHVRFSDTARLRSTLRALDRAETIWGTDKRDYEAHLFHDLVIQHWAENTLPLLPEQQKDPCIEQALALLHRQLDSKIALPTIAAQCGLSYAQFFRRFQAYTGRTPSEYLAFCRLQKAKALLNDPAQSIKSIAIACGFENEYYFSNFFKKQTGVSPSLFRSSLI